MFNCSHYEWCLLSALHFLRFFFTAGLVCKMNRVGYKKCIQRDKIKWFNSSDNTCFDAKDRLVFNCAFATGPDGGNIQRLADAWHLPICSCRLPVTLDWASIRDIVAVIVVSVLNIWLKRPRQTLSDRGILSFLWCFDWCRSDDSILWPAPFYT